MFAANKLWNSFVGLKPFNTRNMKSIIDQYYPLWFSLASKYTGNYHESEELVEEALAAYVQLRHNNISNPKAYIARTIYHLYIDKIRRQKQTRNYIQYALQNQEITAEIGSHIERSTEVTQQLAKMYILLSPAERAVFLLKKAFDFDYEKLQGIFGITYENCRQLMRRAKDKMERNKNLRYNERGQAAKFIDAFFKASKYNHPETLLQLLKAEMQDKVKTTSKVVNLLPKMQFGLSA